MNQQHVLQAMAVKANPLKSTRRRSTLDIEQQEVAMDDQQQEATGTSNEKIGISLMQGAAKAGNPLRNSRRASTGSPSILFHSTEKSKYLLEDLTVAVKSIELENKDGVWDD